MGLLKKRKRIILNMINKKNLINEDYYYKPIKNNKYFISETEYFDILKKADFGYLLKDKKNKTYYANGRTIQGYVYKDSNSYKSGKGICYIPESDFEGINILNDYIDSNNVKEYTRKDILNAVKRELINCYDDLFKSKKIPNKLIENISDEVFNVVDWECPESYLAETDWTEDIIDYFS